MSPHGRVAAALIIAAIPFFLASGALYGSISGSTTTELEHGEGAIHWYVSDLPAPIVSGLVGPKPGSEGHETSGNPTQAFHEVWAKYGHQVNGSECQATLAHTKTDPESFWAANDLHYDYCSTWMFLTFTRSSNDHLQYRVDHDEVEITEKETHMHCQDNTANCPGPPIWTTTPWVKASKPRIQWLRPAATPQDWPDGETTFEPPTPDYDATNGNENAADGDATNANHRSRPNAGGPPGNWRINSSTPNPPEYQDSSTGNASSEHGTRTWKDYSDDPDEQQSYRSESIRVGVQVKTNLDAHPQEIVVYFDNASCLVKLKVKLKQTDSL